MVLPRRSRDDWLQAAANAVRRDGFAAIQVTALARGLGVTKGSFYWHFRDREDLVEELLKLWESETEILIQTARAAPTPVERLIGFFLGIDASPNYPPDIAVFEFARSKPALSPRIIQTETKRIVFFAEQFEALGLPDAEAALAAETIYCTSLGWLEFARRSGRSVEHLAVLAIAAIESQSRVALRRGGGDPSLSVNLQNRIEQ